MLSIILWVVGGVIVLGIAFFIIKIFLIVLGIKTAISVVKEEIEHLPGDYRRMRKEVKNEHATTGAAAKGFLRRIVDRWYKRM